jgi:hypothetical protein
MKYREHMFTIYLYDNQKSQSKKGHKGIMSNNSVISFVMVLVKMIFKMKCREPMFTIYLYDNEGGGS